MNDPRRNPQARPSPQRPARGPKRGDVVLSSRGRQMKKRRNARRIVANIVGSILLSLSLITLAGILALGLRPFAGTTAGEDQKDFDEHGAVDVSENENVAYILIVGVDKSERLSDVMMVVCYDIKNKKANILQLPRDSYVGTELPTGKTAKLNAVYGFPRKNESNINALKRVLNNQFGLPIDHHVVITIDALRDIVDIVGGVTINLERKLTLEDFTTHKRTIKLGPGKVKLTGKLAESFMRERKSYDEGDIGRIKAQRSFYAGFAAKIMDMSFSQMSSAATKCYDKVKTDMRIGELLGYAKAVRGIELSEIGIYAAPGTSRTYRPSGYKRSYSYYSVDTNAYIDLVYAKMNPYGDINYEGINIRQIHSGSVSSNSSSGGTLGELE